jgi:hypothetical protein
MTFLKNASASQNAEALEFKNEVSFGLSHTRKKFNVSCLHAQIQ